MTKEVAMALGHISEQINEMGRRIDHFTNSRIDDITPYTVTKTAYIDDTEVTFTDVPAGNMTVYVKDSEDNYPDYTIDRTGGTVTICFGPLENVTTITLSILKEE